VLLSLAFALFLLVKIFAVIHDAANGRLRCGRNFHQIQGFFAGDLERIEGSHNSQLVAFIVDHANFADANTLVGADKPFVDTVLR
jgi:hypothetical protein